MKEYVDKLICPKCGDNIFYLIEKYGIDDEGGWCRCEECNYDIDVEVEAVYKFKVYEEGER